MEKANVGDKKCIIQVDYSENFSLIDQNEIQTAHWSRRQLSLFTAYLWSNSINQPIVIVSNETTHNKFTVSQCLEHVFKRAKSLVPIVKRQQWYLVMVVPVNLNNDTYSRICQF